MSSWNPWHGCHKISPGCQNCYVYRTDAKYGRDASHVKKTQEFNLPIKRKKNGAYKLQPGDIVFTCFTSDFFLKEADEWRAEAWQMIQTRSDLEFFIITKRIDRFLINLPPDWGKGYPNVSICVTSEDQERADAYRAAWRRHRFVRWCHADCGWRSAFYCAPE